MNKLDKYEYKLRSEQIRDLISKKQYAEAMQVADTIDWRRVKNVSMLTTVSDLYKINRRYDVARDILLMAYDRYPGGRTIVYSLCELSIKLGDIVRAVEYYHEFKKVAPGDVGRYILHYKIIESQEVSLEERINVLEQLKAEDYREKWAYDLAYLYHRAGLSSECVAECDELILTFGEGKYVLKAMELKMLHTQLNPVQQDKYDLWTGRKAADSLSRPDLMAASTKVMPSRDIDIQVKTLDVDNKYNTLNIQAALADSMRELLAKEELEKQLKEKELAVKELAAKELKEKEEAADEPFISPLPDSIPKDYTSYIPSVSEDMSEIHFDDEIKEEPAPAPAPAPAAVPDKPKLDFDMNMDTAKLIQNMAERAALYAAGTPYDNMMSMDNDGQISLVVPEDAKVEKQITGQMSIGDLMNEWERKKQASEKRSYDDIRQRVKEQTGEIFTSFDKAVSVGILAGLEDVNNPLDNLPIQLSVPKEPEKTNVEHLQDSILNDDEMDDLPGVEELSEIDEPEDDRYSSIRSALEIEEPVREEDFQTEESEETEEKASVESAESIDEEEPLEEADEAETEEDPYEIKPDFTTQDIADVAEKLLEETEKEVKGEEAVSASVPSRALTEDEKELFGALIQTDSMKDQIAKAIDEISLASYTGNVIITGEAGSGTLTLAKNLIKSIQMSDSNFSGKAAKIAGAALDKQDIEKTLGKLKNGALIIEKANGLSAESLERICAYLDKDREDGIIVIMEDSKIEMKKCLRKCKSLTNGFTARIDINAMDSDALVAYAKEYAYEKEYSIDDMGVLAIYTRISDLQTGDHSVTLSEVRDIMDEAIWSADKKNLKHFFDILSAHRYDDEDMVILRERDFIC